MNLRNLLWQIPALIVLTIPLWRAEAVSFLTVRQVVKKHGSPDNSLEMQNVVMQQTNSGRDELLLRAAKMYSRDNQRLVYMEKVQARLGGGNNKTEPVLIVSGSAVYNTAQEIITMLDDVVVTGNDFVLKTPVMRFLSKYGRIKSAAKVEAVGRDMKITGNSFMYNLNDGGFRVGSRVHFTQLD